MTAESFWFEAFVTTGSLSKFNFFLPDTLTAVFCATVHSCPIFSSPGGLSGDSVIVDPKIDSSSETAKSLVTSSGRNFVGSPPKRDVEADSVPDGDAAGIDVFSDGMGVEVEGEVFLEGENGALIGLLGCDAPIALLGCGAYFTDGLLTVDVVVGADGN